MYNISIYLNPVESILNQQISSATTEPDTAVLIDLNGKIVDRFVIDNNYISLDINNLPQSIYILQIFNKKGNMQTYKLIKN